MIFIDEAQRVENIGINLKILIDNFKALKIIVTGSSAFELANKVKEPLTGRTITYKLFPMSCFVSLGIRNILIDNLKPIKDRDDVGKLFENFLITERLKLNSYKKSYASSYSVKQFSRSLIYMWFGCSIIS